MTGLAFMLLAAAAAFGLAHLTRIPALPLLLLGGTGLNALARAAGLDVPPSLLRESIEIGLAVLVFAAGVDLSPRRMRHRGRAVAAVAAIQFFVLGLAGAGTAMVLGHDPATALYLGCALSASSTLVAVRCLQQRRGMFEPFGRLVLGVLLLQDVFIILILVVLLRTPEGLTAVLQGVAAAGVLGGFAWVLHRYAAPWVTARLRLDEEELMLGALGLLFAFVFLARFLDLPYMVGGFLAGFVLSAFPVNGLVRGMLGSLSGFFLALFFIGVGAVMTLPSAGLLLDGLVLVVVLVVVTVILVAVVGEAAGYSTRASIEAGLLLSQTSEFSILLALAGLGSGQISRELFSLVALITVGTMTLTPLLSRSSVAWTLMKAHPRLRRTKPSAEVPGRHAVLLGFGRGGAETLKLLQAHGIPSLVVDDDAAVIRRLAGRGVTCIQGDASDERILAKANCREAKVVLCSLRRTRDARVVLDWMRGSPAKIFVRTFEPEEAAFAEARGARAVRTAELSAEGLVAWAAANLPEATRGRRGKGA